MDIEYTPLLTRANNCKARTIINVGGSGSSKSWTIAQLMILKFINEQDKQFIISRKTMPALKRSSYNLIINFLKKCVFGQTEDGRSISYYDRCTHNKSDNTISLNNNTMLFFGIDEPTKAKSIADTSPIAPCKYSPST